MKVIVACEESQAVCKAFRSLGHWAYSCGETKATCLWLNWLPLLIPTNIVTGREQRIWKMGPGPASERSKTFSGVADAMARAWS